MLNHMVNGNWLKKFLVCDVFLLCVTLDYPASYKLFVQLLIKYYGIVFEINTRLITAIEVQFSEFGLSLSQIVVTLWLD